MAVTRAHFAHASSQTQSDRAESTADSAILQAEQAIIEPERDPWLVRTLVNFGHYTHTRVLDRPLPPITDGLALRIQNVSAALAHARENGHLEWAGKLKEADEIYRKRLTGTLDGIKPRDSLRFYRLDEALRNTPRTIEEVKERLSLEFSLCNCISDRRFFHFRNAIADLYIGSAKKAGLTIKPE